jgi:hypothetical protein
MLEHTRSEVVVLICDSNCVSTLHTDSAVHTLFELSVGASDSYCKSLLHSVTAWHVGGALSSYTEPDETNCPDSQLFQICVWLLSWPNLLLPVNSEVTHSPGSVYAGASVTSL